MFYKISVSVILILLFFIAIINYQNYRSQKLFQQATLLYKLQDDFFFKNEKLYKLLRTVEQDKPILIANGGEYTEFDMDDYLGFFELLEKYNEDNTLSFYLIDNQFSYCIIHAYNNAEIKDYIDRLRKDTKSNDAYSGFEKLAKRSIIFNNK